MGSRAGEPLARLRVLVSAPANALGGQALAAWRIVSGFQGHASVQVDLQPIDPQLPGGWARLTRWVGIRSVVKPLLYVAGLLRQVPQVDVVHVFCAAHTAFFFGAVPAVVVARMFRRPIVLNYHDGRAEAHFRWWGPVLRWTIRRSTVLVLPSEYLQQVFQRHGFAGTVVPNVVDTGAFQYRRPEPMVPRLVSARLLEPLYAVDNTLRAFALVQAECPDAACDVYGSGPTAGGLKRLVEQLGLRGVRFHGAVPHAQMPTVFGSGGILVNSSRIDNMPHVLIEAFAAGLPVVSTDAGGIPFIVESERTGLLVPLDRPEALAAAVLRVLREPGLAVRLAEAGRRECSRYSWERAEEGWLRVYRESRGAHAAAGRSGAPAWSDKGACAEHT